MAEVYRELSTLLKRLQLFDGSKFHSQPFAVIGEAPDFQGVHSVTNFHAMTVHKLERACAPLPIDPFGYSYCFL